MTVIQNVSQACRKCGVSKDSEQYPSRHGRPFGRVCRACVLERQNLARAKREGTEQKYALALRNKAFEATGQRECRVCADVKPLTSYRVKSGAHSLRCLSCTNGKLREEYSQNVNGIRDRLTEHGKKRRRKHGERLNAEKKLYVAANRAKVTQRQNDWAKAKLRADPVFALKKRIRSLIGNAFASIGCQKNSETQAILGCTWDEFRAHIERQFTAGMAWDRMGREIHIDHIQPLATAASLQDIIALNHFTNLRPMWATDNIVKGAKVLTLI